MILHCVKYFLKTLKNGAAETAKLFARIGVWYNFC